MNAGVFSETHRHRSQIHAHTQTHTDTYRGREGDTEREREERGGRKRENEGTDYYLRNHTEKWLQSAFREVEKVSQLEQ